MPAPGAHGVPENRGPAKRQRMDSVVQIKQIDGVVAKEGHGGGPELIAGFESTRTPSSRAATPWARVLSA
jgi:hypothetical protein